MPEPEKPPVKPTCPECGTELVGEPETCAKCQFDLSVYPNFYRLFKVAKKKAKEEDDAAEALRIEEEKKKKPIKKPSILDNLRGKKA